MRWFGRPKPEEIEPYFRDYVEAARSRAQERSERLGAAHEWYARRLQQHFSGTLATATVKETEKGNVGIVVTAGEADLGLVSLTVDYGGTVLEVFWHPKGSVNCHRVTDRELSRLIAEEYVKKVPERSGAVG